MVNALQNPHVYGREIRTDPPKLKPILCTEVEYHAAHNTRPHCPDLEGTHHVAKTIQWKVIYPMNCRNVALVLKGQFLKSVSISACLWDGLQLWGSVTCG